jgi:hypothetical protein
MTTRKTVVTAADLFVLLDREFRRRKPRECATCFVQLPFRVDRDEAGAANWELVPPPPCTRGCALVLEEMVAEFQRQYDLSSDGNGGGRR